ncbi:MAG TPA: sigma 54-interacting transcriptional regulator [Woeseiaceae bacterium]
MTWSVDGKIRLGFGLAIGLMIALGAISYASISGLTQTLGLVVKGHNAEATLEELVSHLKDAQRGERGYVLTGDDRFLEPYHQALAEIDSEIADLQELIRDNADQTARLDALRPLIDQSLNKMDEVIAARQRVGFDTAAAAIRNGAGKDIMDRIVEIAALIEEEEERHLTESSAEAASRAGWVLMFIALSSVLAITIVGVASTLVHRDITERKRAEAKLQAAYGDLERRVQERTAELASANTGLRNEVSERKRTEEKLGDMLEQLAQSQSNLLSILNQLRLGSALTDCNGCVTFLSSFAQQIFDSDAEETTTLGKPWESAFPLSPKDTARLQAMADLPAAERSRLPVRLEARNGRHYWMEIDIQDDPRNPRGKIFFFYDVSETYDLRRLLDEQAQFADIIGRSEPMRKIFQQIRDVARVDSTVVIEGETGTGKELVARAVHATSERKDQPFVAVNCAGLSESLLDSQLFGHKKGAFTGAVSDHVGLFEAANGGTLFLDEIGDIPLNVQTSLLRVLQEREIMRVGESRARRIDVRILAATHRNLQEEVRKGTFRADLLYRIRVARIQLPPLRERRGDLPLLVASFIDRGRAATGKSAQEMSDEAMCSLLAYSWPGNVRELKSAVEFALIRCRGPIVLADHLPPEVLDATRSRIQTTQHSPVSLDDEKERVVNALEHANGNRAAAARMLGIGRTTLYRRLNSLGISRSDM